MSRTQILQRLRSLAGTWEEPEIALPEAPTGTDRVAQLAARWEAAGGIFLDAERHGLENVLAETLERTGAREIFWEHPDIFSRFQIPHRLRDPLAFENRLVFSLHPQREVRFPLVLHAKRWTRAHASAVPLSACLATHGVAETGTLLHEVRSGQGRLLSILPEAHLFFLSRGDLVDNAQQLFSTWTPCGQISDHRNPRSSKRLKRF